MSRWLPFFCKMLGIASIFALSACNNNRSDENFAKDALAKYVEVNVNSIETKNIYRSRSKPNVICGEFDKTETKDDEYSPFFVFMSGTASPYILPHTSSISSERERQMYFTICDDTFDSNFTKGE